jgi:ribosome-binding factor A
MVSKARAKRIGDRIREELAVLLLREIADPRLQNLTVMGVEVDRELAFATVYVNSPGDAEHEKSVLQALDGAAGYLRRELSAKVPLRSFPQLRFRWDRTHEHGARIDELLESLDLSAGGDQEESREG